MRKHKEKKNVTRAEIDGDVYVDIAEVLTLMGHKMNFCTARNIVISVMEKIVQEISSKHGTHVNREQARAIASSAEFQSQIAKCLDKLEYGNGKKS